MLGDAANARAVAARGRATVLAQHTFDHRARQLSARLNEHGIAERGRPEAKPGRAFGIFAVLYRLSRAARRAIRWRLSVVQWFRPIRAGRDTDKRNGGTHNR